MGRLVVWYGVGAVGPPAKISFVRTGLTPSFSFFIYLFRCPERFADNEAACLFASYLNGADFWVLPDDFMIQLEPKRGNDLSNFEVQCPSFSPQILAC